MQPSASFRWINLGKVAFSATLISSLAAGCGGGGTPEDGGGASSGGSATGGASANSGGNSSASGGRTGAGGMGDTGMGGGSTSNPTGGRSNMGGADNMGGGAGEASGGRFGMGSGGAMNSEDCPATVPEDGSECTPATPVEGAGGSMMGPGGGGLLACTYDTERCTCRTQMGESSWNCFTLNMGSGGGSGMGTGGAMNSEDCPATAPEADSACTLPEGMMRLSCGYDSGRCTCRDQDGETTWGCFTAGGGMMGSGGTMN